ncbi:MAG: DNA polymerase sliding clamp [Euryarchaeota archaeon]|nr:DNA polymerase sliding clamp [Euryarchaeota archaeon]
MFRATINAGLFKDAVEAVSTLVDQGRFLIDKEKVLLRAVDAANVAMVSLTLPARAFEKFEAKESEVGLDIKKLAEFLLMVENPESIRLEVDEGAKKLKMKMGGLEATIGLLDLAHLGKMPSIRNFDLPARIVLSGSDFRMGIRAAEKVGDQVTFAVEGDSFVMEAEGDTDHVRLALAKDKLMELKGANVKSLYSLDYLTDMAKVVGKSVQARIELGSELPMKISFPLADDRGQVEYLLAPRVDKR